LRAPIEASAQKALAYGYSEIGAMRCFEQLQKSKWGCINPHFCNYKSWFISALKLKGGASSSPGIVTMTGIERLPAGKSRKISD